MTKEEFQDLYDSLSYREKQAFALSIKDEVLDEKGISDEELPWCHYSKEELMAALTKDNVYDIDVTKKELTVWLEKQVMD